jgi:hypothetical protein
VGGRTHNCKENDHTFMSTNGHTANAFSFFVEEVGLENISNQSMTQNVQFIQPRKRTKQDHEIVSGARRPRTHTHTHKHTPCFPLGAGNTSSTLQSTISDSLVVTDCRGFSKHTSCTAHIIVCKLSRWLTRVTMI